VIPTDRPTDLDLVVPCYNEQEALPATHRELSVLMSELRRSGRISERSRILYIDDGSRDQTWSIIESIGRDDPGVIGIRLSRNFGHQAAVLAGLFTASGDAVISVDADLQDDIGAIPQMLERYRQGCEIVYGVRRGRPTDTAFKRNTALLYYRLLRTMGVDIVHNHADYRLMGRRAIEALKEFDEVNLFLRGMVPLIGYRTESVYYDRKLRLAGESKYNFAKMLRLAIEGITSLSAVPLRLVAVMGMLVFLLSIGMGGWVIFIRLFTDRAIPGWASSVVPIYFLGGIQLLCLGVIGEYVAKTYIEVKRRPRYLIAETIASRPAEAAQPAGGGQITAHRSDQAALRGA
jgi:glycosyltransferase involved in cell wall biosynthesis